MTTLYQIAKMLHIIGFVAAIGVTLATFIAYKRFWILYGENRDQGIAAFKAFAYLQIAGMIGFATVLVGGLTMVFLVNWSFASLLWFQIKLSLIVLLFVNGLTLGRTSAMKFQKFLSDSRGSSLSDVEIQSLRRRLNRFQLLQLFLFTAIIVLSVFRFV